MRIITGDECGIIKECLPDQGEANGVQRIHNASHPVSRKHGCVGLCWVGDESSQQQDATFASISMDSVCSVWKRSTNDNESFAKYRKEGDIASIFDDATPSTIHPSTRPLGLFAMPDGNRLCACNAAGKVSIINMTKEKVVKTFDTVQATDQDDPNKPLLTTCLVQVEENRLAVGGQERDVTLWDLATGKEMWKAKNARPDPQTLLQQQVWPSSLAFVERHVLAVGSAHAEIRLYDIRQQRRPIALTPKKGMWEHRITALCPLPDHSMVIGDSAGFLQTMDWRQLQQIQGRFVGPVGSIRSIVVHPSEARLAVVGLDRMLRIYDYQTRKQLHCSYLRQRLNCCLFGQRSSIDAEQEDGANTTTAEEGDWDQDDRIEDYVDSDNEEGEGESAVSENDDDDDGEGGESARDSVDKTSEGEPSNSEEDLDSDDDCASDDDESSSGSDNDDDDDEEEDKKPRKRVRR